MTHINLPRIAYVAAVSLIGLALLSTMVTAQSAKVEGLIKTRNGETMVVETSESPKLVVLLTDHTQVGQVQGMLKARRKGMSMAALIPGLAVKVEGTYNNENQLPRREREETPKPHISGDSPRSLHTIHMPFLPTTGDGFPTWSSVTACPQ